MKKSIIPVTMINNNIHCLCGYNIDEKKWIEFNYNTIHDDLYGLVDIKKKDMKKIVHNDKKIVILPVQYNPDTIKLYNNITKHNPKNFKYLKIQWVPMKIVKKLKNFSKDFSGDLYKSFECIDKFEKEICSLFELL